MAAKGRCAGCGFEAPLGRKIETHLMGCSAYARVFAAQTPEAPLLEPEAEYDAYHLSGQAARDKEERLAGYHSALQRRKEVADARWEGGSGYGHLATSSRIVLTPPDVPDPLCLVRPSSVGSTAAAAVLSYLDTLS
jgi:hypothetical protein